MFPLKASKKEDDSGDGFQHPEGASTHPEDHGDKKRRYRLPTPIQLFLKRPRQKAKAASGQVTSKCMIHGWHKHVFAHSKHPTFCMKSAPTPYVQRKLVKRHHSAPSTQQKKPLRQLPFQEKLCNHLLLQSHFPSRATTEKQLCPLIQVWCGGRKRREGEGGQWMAFSMISLSSPGLEGMEAERKEEGGL